MVQDKKPVPVADMAWCRPQPHLDGECAERIVPVDGGPAVAACPPLLHLLPILHNSVEICWPFHPHLKMDLKWKSKTKKEKAFRFFIL